MDQQNILMRPIITEKSMDEAGRGRFTFAVAKEANKPQVRKAVEDRFKVNVVSIRTLITKGRTRRTGKKRSASQIAPFKKAIVELKAGQRIDLFEIQTEKPKEGKENHGKKT